MSESPGWNETRESQNEPTRLNRARLIAAALELIGVVLGLVGIGWAIEQFYTISQAEAISRSGLVSALAMLTTALSGAVLLWGIASAVRQLETLNESLRENRSETGQAARPTSGTEGGQRGAATVRNDTQEKLLRELIGVMREVRDISLLTDPQRSKRQDLQAQDQARRLQEEVPELLREHNWFEASKRVQSARERFPSLNVWDALEQQIAAVRSQVESRDIEAATRQIEELASLAAWERASDVISDLLERHPGAQGAIELARRIRRQRDKAEAETRIKLMAQAQQHTNQREWPEALAVANMVIQRFPKSQEAEALRLQLPTLEANAEIKLRQKLELNIRELLNQRRFDEALGLAHELIERYPHSKQAEILREQLPRLEEMASQGTYV